MIDACRGFMKDGNKNRLRSQDIHKIVDVFNKQIEVDRVLAHGAVAEIADPKNDYNLNIPRYIDSSEPEDLHDLTPICTAASPSATSTRSPLLGRLTEPAHHSVHRRRPLWVMVRPASLRRRSGPRSSNTTSSPLSEIASTPSSMAGAKPMKPP